MTASLLRNCPLLSSKDASHGRLSQLGGRVVLSKKIYSGGIQSTLTYLRGKNLKLCPTMPCNWCSLSLPRLSAGKCKRPGAPGVLLVPCRLHLGDRTAHFGCGFERTLGRLNATRFWTTPLHRLSRLHCRSNGATLELTILASTLFHRLSNFWW